MKVEFDITKMVEEIAMQAKETQEEFIFETIRPYCENVLQIKINKEELKQILLNGIQKQQPCEDCISRQEALNEINKKVLCYTYEARKIIENLPSVQPQPKRGKWIFNENMHDYCCSECGCLMPNVNEYYRKKIIGCPYCLADMREVQDD